jgi:hypothetical protein
MIIDLRKMDQITPKGCQGFLTRIMPSLWDLDAIHDFLSIILSSLRDCKLRNISW